jgi:HAD superfamily hydrolase (TIGR01509 family)
MSLPAPSSVRVLLLDVGGVLVRPNFERLAGALQAHGVFADPDAMAAAEPRVKKALDRPPSPGLSTDAERAEVKAWHDQHCLWEDVIDGVRPSLRRLRAAGLRLAAVSNSNGTLQRLFDRLGFTASFEVILDSQVLGIEKPDPRIFRLALEKLGADASAALHVGDLYNVDVVGARAAGVGPVLVDEAGLYPDADCPRVQSLAELAAHLVPEANGPVSAKLPADR